VKRLTESRAPASRLVLALGIVSALTGLIILATGGGRFELGGARFSLTAPWRPAFVAAICFILFTRLSPGGWRAEAVHIVSALRARPAALAVMLALVVIGAGRFWGSNDAGGADSSGYVNQAQLWRHGRLVIEQPFVSGSPWPLAEWTWSPLGFRPAVGNPNAIVPLYPPGLPLLMAAAQSIAGFCGAFLVVPLCGGLAIWLTYALGQRLFGRPGVALWAALLVATSPVFLFQLMNPMSDVPVTAAWTLALVLVLDERPWLAGLAAAAAIAIRPTLGPLALVLLAWTAQRDWRSTLRLSLGMAPGIAGIAALNTYLYGSPLLAGYGSAADLYSLSYGLTNARQYLSWLIDVETPIVPFAALFFIAPVFVGPPRVRSPRLLLGGALVVEALAYLFYKPFDAWWYLRFLLPMWPVLMVLTAAGILAVLGRWTGRASPLIAALLIVFLAQHGLATAAARGVFEFGPGERKYGDVARFISDQTDPQAVLLSVQHSGSLRLYTGRLTLKYDVLDPLWLDRTVAYLQSIDRHPYIVLDAAEVDGFRRRFAESNRLGALDWAPMAVLPGASFVYDTGDPTRMATPVRIASTADDRRVCHVPAGSW
jgi:hypothetical protein